MHLFSDVFELWLVFTDVVWIFLSFIMFDSLNYAWLSALKFLIQDVFAHFRGLIMNDIVDVSIWFERHDVVCYLSFNLHLISLILVEKWVCMMDLNMSPRNKSCAHFWVGPKVKDDVVAHFDWSIWIIVLFELFVLFGIMFDFILWSKHFQKS